ncbi:hypothetical protein N7457_006934 [Penicillium paradoxum]|uniref:uncharacterized protein n=1 Tax=Penicillium paradoxum TaxID=176176 RepID=UPI002548736E|nr:uncharacterized protein N7457_006934 [Penicillium paradoxum]KAJ5779214.1 hypothetical protein N7457_006934 [Penicillium paradoxum]
MADIMEEDPSSGLQSSEMEEEMPVESLVKGRAKRSTAGLHMSALLEAAADDDLALLFEEVEDDNEFADVIDPDAEDDLALESSDEEEDQGPNVQNDYEGEQKLQKEERKKRKTQNDLRFQTLRKRVKIDPTAPSAMAAAPRPKKKSERISWIPTLEDGPTRQSSRRQTMVNKELTHARLKDSQEKRVRIIATMKEAEKRKAHLKPKQMTQEDHLAEAARIERLNSKSLNRWELSEKRKADERRARIEALQNRRLDGPVMSYWSGVATWTNGRLTRVGKIDIKPKPDKEESKKKKKEKEEKEKAAAELKPLGPATAAGIAPVSITAPSQLTPNSSAVGITVAPNSTLPNLNPTLDQKPPEDEPPSENIAAPTVGNTDTSIVSVGTSVSQPRAKSPDIEPTSTNSTEQGNENAMEKEASEVDASAPVPSSEHDKAQPDERRGLELLKGPERKMFAVEIPAPRRLSNSAGNDSTQKLPSPTPTKNDDAMDVDQPPAAAADSNAVKANHEVPESKDQAILPTSNAANAQRTSVEIPKPDAAVSAVREHPLVGESRPVDSATSIGTEIALAPPASPAATAPSQAPVPENASTSSLNQPSTAQNELQSSDGIAPAPTQPEIPQPPPVIEHTGRSLTILENFDYATANHRKYSMYFNAKKPARLTKISSSLCVITSLPSRYRDPETALPYANSYAYGQIRRMLSEGYIWSSMLGCFVGPAQAARGVPERFTGKPGPGTVRYQPEKSDGQAESITGKGVNLTHSNGEIPSTPTTQLAPPGEPMEVDKP